MSLIALQRKLQLWGREHTHFTFFFPHLTPFHFHNLVQAKKMKIEVGESLSMIAHHPFLCTQLFPTAPRNTSRTSPTCAISIVSPEDSYSMILLVIISRSHCKGFFEQPLPLLLLVSPWKSHPHLNLLHATLKRMISSHRHLAKPLWLRLERQYPLTTDYFYPNDAW